MAAARRDIDRQRRLDDCYDADDHVLTARIRAIASAKRAVAEDEPDAVYTLRQSLVDLAAIAEELPAPARTQTTFR